MDDSYFMHEENIGWSRYEFKEWQYCLKSILQKNLFSLEVIDSTRIADSITDYSDPPIDHYQLSFEKSLFWIEEWINITAEYGCKFISDQSILSRRSEICFLFCMLVHDDYISIDAQIKYKVISEYCRDSRVGALLLREEENIYHAICTKEDQWNIWLRELNGDLPNSYTPYGIYI